MTALDQLRGGATPAGKVELEVTGMTCAACAARIEKKLNRLDGVTATVNYATEKATVEFDPDALAPADLIATVQSIGYDAHLPAPPLAAASTGVPGTPGGVADGEPDRWSDPLLQRLVLAAVLGTPVLLLSMVPALQFRNWQWLAFALSAPVAAWAAWPFHRAALEERPPGRGVDGHAGVGRRARRVRVEHLRAVLHPGGRQRHDDGRCRWSGASATTTTCTSRSRPPPWRSSWPAGTSRRARSGAPAARSAPCSSAAPARAGARRPRRRARRPGRRAPGGRPVRGAPRRTDRHRRRGGGRHLVDRHLARHRREPAARRAPGRRRHGSDDQRPTVGSSCARRASGPTPRSLRWRASSSRPRAARRPCSASPTGWPAVFVPVVVVLAIATLGVVVRSHRQLRGRDGPGDGRADHRLPVRARPRHPDRPARRHRPRRAARHPHQGDPRCSRARVASTPWCSTRPAR
jgi:copper chaperone CopZ